MSSQLSCKSLADGKSARTLGYSDLLCLIGPATLSGTVAVGAYRGLPPLVRAAQQKNDLVLQLGQPFLNLLQTAEEIGNAITESTLSRDDKHLARAEMWWGRHDSSKGLRDATRRLFQAVVGDGNASTRSTIRAWAIAEKLVSAALERRGLWAAGSQRNRTPNAKELQ